MSPLFGGAGGAVEVDGCPGSFTGVGAILLFFSRPCSSDSETLLTALSRFTPAVTAGMLFDEPLI